MKNKESLTLDNIQKKTCINWLTAQFNRSNIADRRTFKGKFSRHNYFTLIELIAVIVILGITMAVAIPRYVNMANEAKMSVASGIVAEYNAREKGVWAKLMVNSDPVTQDDITLDQAIYSQMDFELSPESSNDWVFTPGSGGAGSARNATLQLEDFEVPIFRTPAAQSNPAIWKRGSMGDAGEIHNYDNVKSSGGATDYIDPELITGSGDDQINIADSIQGADMSVNTGGGDDQLTVGVDVEYGATVDTGDGNDTITIGNDVRDDSTIDTGDGNDTVTINGDLQDDTALDTGAGNDTITIDRVEDDPTLHAGSGDDTVVLKDVSSSFDNGLISLGDGNDSLVINDSLRGSKGKFDGGDGDTDSVTLTAVSLSKWNNGLKNQFSGFESVTLSNGITYSVGENNSLTPL